MLKLSDNPDIISPPTDDLSSIAGTWWVAHTKSRCEKALAGDFVARGIAYFLPMVERVTFSGGRKRRGMMPLFHSYVFFCGGERERLATMLTDRVCQIIEVRDQRRLVCELSAAHRALAGKIALDPYPFAAVGQRVRVAHGPMQGIEGIVVRRDGYERLVLEISILGQGASMEIAPEFLEAVDTIESHRRAS
jgi:hypothetical protein